MPTFLIELRPGLDAHTMGRAWKRGDFPRCLGAFLREEELFRERADAELDARGYRWIADPRPGLPAARRYRTFAYTQFPTVELSPFELVDVTHWLGRVSPGWRALRDEGGNPVVEIKLADPPRKQREETRR